MRLAGMHSLVGLKSKVKVLQVIRDGQRQTRGGQHVYESRFSWRDTSTANVNVDEKAGEKRTARGI
jgi:hypothetical protein